MDWMQLAQFKAGHKPVKAITAKLISTAGWDVFGYKWYSIQIM